MTEPHTHGVEDLCAAGTEVYERALREGHVSRSEAEQAPCLLDFGLLIHAVTDLRRLEPVAPAVAFHRMLRAMEDRVAEERRREQRLAETFEPLMRIDGRPAGTERVPTIGVLSGLDRIGAAITQAMADSSGEVLAIQPHITHTAYTAPEFHIEALARDQALLDRGGRIRTLYQHTLRQAPSIIARYERLRGNVAARTLDVIPDRLIVVDRTVAFMPANEDRTLALEVRNPSLVTFCVTVFDRLWHLATPLYPESVEQPSLNGITPRQRAIATLLVEGHTDAVIADRLGMNIRTVRVHIAKLAATLGSESRAQLGYLIAESGILRPEGAAE
ncbi:LuxR C-terminal-related transcriptional regulator [Streptomyces sp. NPDC050528]|uniref:helix-turn-helix transcriptional regulator n=1 Tax=Streptomyces sp. NPDC050528 TaxID=3365623 RepID=UPI0037B31A5A